MVGSYCLLQGITWLFLIYKLVKAYYKPKFMSTKACISKVKAWVVVLFCVLSRDGREKLLVKMYIICIWLDLTICSFCLTPIFPKFLACTLNDRTRVWTSLTYLSLKWVRERWRVCMFGLAISLEILLLYRLEDPYPISWLLPNY